MIMKQKIEFIKLYKCLTRKDGENLKPFEAVRNIRRIRQIKNPAILTAIKEYLEDEKKRTPKITINGVSCQRLVNEEDMKPVRALLFLDWLDREPENAFTYMVSDRFKSPRPDLSDKQRNELDGLIAKMKEKHPEVCSKGEIPEEDPEVCSKGEDITFDDSVSQNEEENTDRKTAKSETQLQ